MFILLSAPVSGACGGSCICSCSGGDSGNYNCLSKNLTGIPPCVTSDADALNLYGGVFFFFFWSQVPLYWCHVLKSLFPLPTDSCMLLIDYSLAILFSWSYHFSICAVLVFIICRFTVVMIFDDVILLVHTDSFLSFVHSPAHIVDCSNTSCFCMSIMSPMVWWTVSLLL